MYKYLVVYSFFLWKKLAKAHLRVLANFTSVIVLSKVI